LTASDYPIGIFKLLAIVLSVLLWLTTSDYLVGIFKLLAILMSVLLVGIIRSRQPEENRQYNGQKYEDTNEVIRSRQPEKNRQYNGKKFEDTNGIIRSRQRRRTGNTMAKSLKIPTG
jgi:hypothetical protein